MFFLEQARGFHGDMLPSRAHRLGELQLYFSSGSHVS